MADGGRRRKKLGRRALSPVRRTEPAGEKRQKSGEPQGSPLWQQVVDYLALWDLEWLGATYWPFSFLTSLPSLTSSLGV